MRLLPLLALCAILSSCETFRFYGQAVGGQMEILRKSRPNEKVIAASDTPESLREKLRQVEKIREFASGHLLLPADESYGKYADLGREHVVWVLYAAPEFSLKPKTWYYPTIGELGYRGYFRKEDTVEMARRLKGEGYDVCVGGVDAYSTLGWFHDPVLNTFAHYHEIDLAETIFHELTHRKVFKRGDTVFNESLANVVAEEGVRRWLRHQGRLKELEKYEGRLVRRRQFYREIDVARNRLEALYASDRPDHEKRREKARILKKLRGQFLDLRRRWGGQGLEGWLREEIHNGHIVSLNLYADQMPAFEKLLADCNGDLAEFYRRVNRAIKLGNADHPDQDFSTANGRE
ncbi:MAG: aminopeptidase [Luteolibacter sp.]